MSPKEWQAELQKDLLAKLLPDLPRPIPHELLLPIEVDWCIRYQGSLSARDYNPAFNRHCAEQYERVFESMPQPPEGGDTDGLYESR